MDDNIQGPWDFIIMLQKKDDDGGDDGDESGMTPGLYLSVGLHGSEPLKKLRTTVE